MKKLITTTAMLMLLTTSIASAQEVNRTQEYRMWSAEQMINRVTDKLVRWRKMCDQAEYSIGQRISEKCIADVLKAYPALGTIRDIAASGNDVLWVAAIDATHKFEREIEAPLNTMERK